MSWYNPLTWGKDSDESIRQQSQFQDRDQIMGLINQGLGSAGGRPAPTTGYSNAGPAAMGHAAQIDQSQQGQFRGMQMQQAQSLLGQALGTQKGPGQLAAQDATARGIGGQAGMMRSARGSNGGMMGLGAARNAADIGISGVGQQAQAGMQDKQNANAMLTQALGAGRSQDIGLATSQAGFQQQTGLANQSARNSQQQFQAGLNQQANLANLQAQLQQTGMNDAQINSYMQALLGMNQSELAAYANLQGSNQGMIGGLLQAGGQIGAAMAMPTPGGGA